MLRRSDYAVEQMTFTLSLLPYLVRHKPDVIYFSDGNIGNALWHWRRLTNAKFKLLFCNGGPLSPPFPRCDYVQQVSPVYLEEAVRAGQPVESQSIVPYGFAISPQKQLLQEAKKRELRHKLNLPIDRAILLSVGAINMVHKRMDYVVREVAALESRPYLLLLGQQEDEAKVVLELGNRLLGSENLAVRTVSQDQVNDYYQIADAFVLASLNEGFGRVVIEAMSHGLLCLAHDSQHMRYLLGEYGYFSNFQESGNLTQLLQENLRRLGEPDSSELERVALQQADAYERFSWERLLPDYIKMFQKCNKYQ